MDKREILDKFAREQGVEQIVLALTRRRVITYDLCDLVQIVYLALLETKEEKIVQLWERGELRYYATGITRRQLTQERSAFASQVYGLQSRMTELTDEPKEQ